MALQLNILNQSKRVINLEPKEVLKYMEEQPFTEVCPHCNSFVIMFGYPTFLGGGEIKANLS